MVKYAAPFGCRAVETRVRELPGGREPAHPEPRRGNTRPHISMVAAIPPGALSCARASSSTITRTSRAARSKTPSEASRRRHDEPRDDLALAGPRQGVPVKAPRVASTPPARAGPRALARGVRRGFTPSGEQLRAPHATRDEVPTLVRAAWFFTAAADARAATSSADASVGRPAPNHVDIVAAVHHRHKTAGGASPALAALLPPLTMSDTDFRLRESRCPRRVQQALPAQPGADLPRGEQDHAQLARRVGDREGRLPPGGGAGAPPRDRAPLRPRPPRPRATYAAWHVRAHVLRSVHDKAHLVRLPQNLQADMHQIKRARYPVS